MSRPIKEYTIGIFDGPHATPKEASDGPIFLGIKNITDDGRLDFSDIKHVSEEDFPKWTRRVIPQPGDVVFTYEATLHRYALIPEGFRGCLGRRVALIRPNPIKVDNSYLLYYFLSSGWRKIVESFVITGATVDRIPLEKFPEIPAKLPDLLTQKRIATILSAYDDLIENNRRRIQLLEESARLLYKEWFVYLRFPGHEHVKVVDGVPEGWEKMQLGQKIVLNYGKALNSEKRIEGQYPVYGSSGIVGSHEKALATGPGIIVGRKGTVGSIYWSYKDFWPIDTVYFITSDQSTYYLYHVLHSMQFVSSDAAVPGLNRDFAYSRLYLQPSNLLMNQFEETVKPVYEQVFKLEQQNEKLRQARDLLLPRLMNGAIEV